MSHKTIGVLGGMGPAATALFFERIIALTPARTDQDHIPVVIYNNPKIPDRTASLVGDGPSSFPELIRSVHLLERAGVDFVCMPCNTAHAYYRELQSETRVPIMNLIEIVADRVSAHGTIKKVGLLATPGTLRSNLYQDALGPRGIEVLMPEAWEVNDLLAVIKRLKDNTTDGDPAGRFAEHLQDRGAQGLILGCTELSLVRTQFPSGVPIFDAIEILAEAAVWKAVAV